jgi:hypothetical protein
MVDSTQKDKNSAGGFNQWCVRLRSRGEVGDSVKQLDH